MHLACGLEFDIVLKPNTQNLIIPWKNQESWLFFMKTTVLIQILLEYHNSKSCGINKSNFLIELMS